MPGHTEPLLLATEMLALAQRTNSARTAMWVELWRIDALLEDGQLAAAAEELAALQLTVERVGGPVSADFHATGSAQGSGELGAWGPVVPPGTVVWAGRFALCQ